MSEIETVYYCFDGDRVGESIQLYFMSNDLRNARGLSDALEKYMGEIQQTMIKHGASAVFRGGDSLIFQANKSLSDDQIPHRFPMLTFSVGTGSSLEEAAIALFKAKALGRARIVRGR